MSGGIQESWLLDIGSEDEQVASKAFDGIYESLSARVAKIIAAYLRGYGCCQPDAVRTLVDEVFVAMFEESESQRWENVTQLKKWLARVSRNKAVDLVRKRIKHSVVGTGLLMEPVDRRADSDPHGNAIAKEFAESVDKALKELNPRQCQALMMRAFEELTDEEIASQLETSVRNVQLLIHRARVNLLGHLVPGERPEK